MTAHANQNKHDAHARLVIRLRQQTEDIRRLTRDLDEGLLSRRVVPEKWSLRELVCHIWRVQDVFDFRVRAMLESENPGIEPYTPESDPEFERLTQLPVEKLFTGFFEAREVFLSGLENLSAPQWHRKGKHPEFENYDVHFQVEYMAHHEAHHIYQMLQRRAPLGKLPH